MFRVAAVFAFAACAVAQPPFVDNRAILTCAYGAFRLWRETLGATPQYLPWAAVFTIGVAALTVVPGSRRRVPTVLRERNLTGGK